MAIKLVQFQDKTNLNTNPQIPEINKIIDANMNELKEVANTNANSIGNLENLNTTDKTSIVNAINELAKPSVLVKNKNISVNLNNISVRGNFTADIIDGYTLTSVQAVNVPSADSNTINFNISGNTVYWLCTRQGYSNSGTMIARLLYVRNDLIE